MLTVCVIFIVLLLFIAVVFHNEILVNLMCCHIIYVDSKQFITLLYTLYLTILDYCHFIVLVSTLVINALLSTFIFCYFVTSIF